MVENVVYMYQNISMQIYEYQQAPQFFLLIFKVWKKRILYYLFNYIYRLWYISAKSNFPHFVARTAKVKQQQIFCPGSGLNFEMLVPLIFKHIFFHRQLHIWSYCPWSKRIHNISWYRTISAWLQFDNQHYSADPLQNKQCDGNYYLILDFYNDYNFVLLFYLYIKSLNRVKHILKFKTSFHREDTCHQRCIYRPITVGARTKTNLCLRFASTWSMKKYSRK